MFQFDELSHKLFFTFLKEEASHDRLICLFCVKRHFYVTQGATSFESTQCKSRGFHIFGHNYGQKSSLTLRTKHIKGIKGTGAWTDTKQSNHRNN